MEQSKQTFHLAVPTHDIGLAKKFYSDGLGANIGREYPDYVIFDFFGHQLVCHTSEVDLNAPVSMYPRHFGIIVDHQSLFDIIYEKAKKANLRFFEKKFERYKNSPAWHWSFFLIDPSNNLIEFKYYKNQNLVFST